MEYANLYKEGAQMPKKTQKHLKNKGKVCADKKPKLQKAHRTQRQNKALAKQILDKYNTQKTERVFVAGGSRPGYNAEYAAAAFQLGQVIGKRNYQLAFGFSPKGIMGAVAQGVLETWKKKDKSLLKPIQGVTTEHYQKLYPDDDLLKEVTDVIVSHTLEERKQNLLSADFVVFAPGGLGTLDELVYDCVAMQDGWLKIKPFVFFNVGEYFHHLLEYLKDIHLKGFSDRMPFIVVDNLFEINVVFDMIAFYHTQMKNKKDIVQIVDKIIYELPYVIEQLKKDETLHVSRVLKDAHRVLEKGSLKEKQTLSRAIELAYLNKEIQRMNERLISTSRDTALASRKLDILKHKMEKTRETNGFY